MRSSDWHVAVAVMPFLLLASTSPAAAQFTPLALAGQPAPGCAERFASFSTVGLTAGGKVVLRGNLQVASGSDQGVWFGAPGALSLHVRTGTAAPGTTSTYSSLASVLVNDSGCVALVAQLDSTYPANFGAWLGEADSMSLLARSASATTLFGPGVTYGTVPFTAFETFGIDGDGRSLFTARLAGAGVTSTNDQALLRAGPGGLELIARKGDVMPGATQPFNQDFISQRMNMSGEMALYSRRDGPTQPLAGLWWRDSAGTITPVMLGGQEAPGTGGRTFYPISGYGTIPSVNDRGELAFHHGFAGYDAPSGVFFGTPEAIDKVVMSGESALGPGINATFESFSPPHLTQTGGLFFDARITGDGVDALTNDGLWAWNGSLVNVLREGDTLPGLPVGVVLGDGGGYVGIFGGYVPNSQGWVVGASRVTGDDVTTDNDRILYVANVNSGYRGVLLREGQDLDVGPGDTRTIASFDFRTSGGSAAGGPMPLGLDEAGNLAVTIKFTDGSAGAFYAAVPEPSALVGLALFATAIAGVLLARRHK